MVTSKASKGGVAPTLYLLAVLALLAAPGFADNFSDSASFNDSGYINYPPCSVNTSVSGNVTVGGSVDSSGVAGTTSQTYTSNSSSGLYANTVWSGECDGIPIAYTGASVSKVNANGSNLTRVKYYGGTGLQNAYAAMTSMSKSIGDATGSLGLGSFQNAGGGMSFQYVSGNYGPWQAYFLGSAGDDLEGVGQVASVGSGVYVNSGATGSSSFGATYNNGGLCGPGKVDGTYGSTQPQGNVTVVSFGPNPVAMSAAFANATPGSSASSSNYSSLPGTGSDNTTQVPIWPVSLVYDNKGKYIGEVASACGTPAYVKDASGGSTVGSFSNASVSTTWSPSADGLSCGPTSYPYTYSGSTNSPQPPTIEGRPIECKGLSGDLATVLCGGASSCACSGGTEPTQDNIAYAQQTYPASQGYTTRTFDPVQADPDPLPWPATDPGFGYVLGWASTAYVTFTPSTTCGTPVTGGGNQPMCTVSASPNPQDTGQNVTWTTTLYKADNQGIFTPWNTPATYKWTGSDSISATTTTNYIKHSYQSGGQQYAVVVATTASGQQATCSNNTQVNSTLQVSCTGTPSNSTLDPNGTSITWQAFPKGGAGQYNYYSYSWNLDPTDPNADTTQQAVTATYTKAGKKNATVTVTDTDYTTGKTTTATANCSTQINTFNATCFPDKTTAFTGDTITWTALPNPSTGSYTYNWTGTDNMAGTNQTNQKTYTSTGTKTASVDVTYNGVKQTVPCGNVNITQEPPPGPWCNLSGPTSIDPGSNALITATITGFKNPITSATATCSDSATTKDSQGNDTSQACTQTSDATAPLNQCSFSCNNYTASPTAISLTLSNSANEKATCNLNYGTSVTPPAPACSLTPTPQTVSTGKTASFTLNFSNFTTTPAPQDMNATCTDGTTTNTATITNCTATQTGTGTCTATCPAYTKTGGPVNASITNGTQNTACQAAQVNTTNPPTCTMTASTGTNTIQNEGIVNFTVEPQNFSPQANAFVTPPYPLCGNYGTLVPNSVTTQNGQFSFKCQYNNTSTTQQTAIASAELENQNGDTTPNACTATVKVPPSNPCSPPYVSPLYACLPQSSCKQGTEDTTKLCTQSGTVCCQPATPNSPNDFVSVSIAPDKNPPDYIIGDNLNLSVTLTKMSDKKLNSDTVAVTCQVAGGNCPQFSFAPQTVNDPGFLTGKQGVTTTVTVPAIATVKWSSGAYTFTASSGATVLPWTASDNTTETIVRNNVASTIVTISQAKQAIPEMPVVFAAIIAIAVVATIVVSGRNRKG